MNHLARIPVGRTELNLAVGIACLKLGDRKK